MAALLTLTETELLELSETDLLAMTTDGSSSGGSSSASCLWTEARIAAIETRLASIESALAKLATSAEVISAQSAILAQCKTATGFATPSDVKLTTTTQTVEVISQTVDLADLKTHGDSHWKTATGFATPNDVKPVVTTETVEVISQTVDLSGVATQANQTAILSKLERVETRSDNIAKDVTSVFSYVTGISTVVESLPDATVIAESVWHYKTPESRIVTAGSVEISGDVNVDSEAIAEKVWSNPARTLSSFPEWLATSSEIQTLASGRTLAELATSEDVNLAKNSILNGIPSVEEIQNGVALESSVESLPTLVWEAQTRSLTASVDISDTSRSSIRTGLATSSSISTLKGLVQALPSAEDIWGNESRTLSEFPAMVLTTDYDRAKRAASPDEVRPVVTTEVVNVSTQTIDTSQLAKESTVEELKSYGDAHWKTSVGLDGATLAEEVWSYGNRTLTGYTPSTPEEVVGSVYCIRSDMERRWGIKNITYWADLESDNDAAKIQTQIDWAIQTASRKIDTDLSSSMYSVPFSTVPPDVRKHCAILAGIELYSSRRMQETEDNNLINTAMAEYQNWVAYVLGGGIIAGASLFESE